MNYPVLYPVPNYRIVAIPEPTMVIQIKRHHKKRINKKWRKRYGFATVAIKYDPTKLYVDELHQVAYCYNSQVPMVRQMLQTAH